MIYKFLFTFFVLFTNNIFSNGQEIKYLYDRAGHITETSYPNQTKINYFYDKDGNRIQKVESKVVVVTNTIAETSIDKKGLILFPNPTSGFINGKFYNSSKQQIIVSIYSITGTIVHSYFFIADVGECTFTFNITPLASGTYSVEVKSKEKIYSEKIIVK